jgi:hypothetical protein
MPILIPIIQEELVLMAVRAILLPNFLVIPESTSIRFLLILVLQEEVSELAFGMIMELEEIREQCFSCLIL